MVAGPPRRFIARDRIATLELFRILAYDELQYGEVVSSERPNNPATYRVRFESYDDFLVEYTDRLRHGFALLPLPEPLAEGSKVRLKLQLPDDRILHLTGATEAPSRADRLAASEQVTRITLAPLSVEQKEALQNCVNTLVLEPGQSPEDTLVAGETPGDAISVLLVDDSVSTRIELGDALRARGIRVRVAENGLVALSAALKRAPDVVLTDVEMPVMDGWTLLRTFRSRSQLSPVPVVFLTRLSDELTRLRGYRMGVDDYLPKTMATDEIIARVQGVLARHRMAHGDKGEGMRGKLDHVRLGSLLAFLDSERRGGALFLHRGNDHATLHIRDGALELVENLGRFQHPHDRVFELLDWIDGTFELVDDAPRPDPSRDGSRTPTPLNYLLMEHARRQDEAAATDPSPPRVYG